MGFSSLSDVFSSWNYLLFSFWLSVMMAPFDRAWAQLTYGRESLDPQLPESDNKTMSSGASGGSLHGAASRKVEVVILMLV